MQLRDKLLAAIEQNEPETIALLLKSADNAQEMTSDMKSELILSAALAKNWNCVKILCENIKLNDYTLLFNLKSLIAPAYIADQTQCSIPDDILTLLYKQDAAKDALNVDDEGCLHQAVRWRNESLIALLLSCGFSLDKTDSQRKTPAQRALYLDEFRDTYYPIATNPTMKRNIYSSALLNAMQIHLDTELLKAQVTTIILLQAQRQKSFLGGIANDALDKILSFLNQDIFDRYRSPTESTKKRLAEISAACKFKKEEQDKYAKTAANKLVKSFHSFFHRDYSEESKGFVADLKNTLQQDGCNAQHIGKSVQKFLIANNKKKNRTLELLMQYGLMTFVPPTIPESKEENTPTPNNKTTTDKKKAPGPS